MTCAFQVVESLLFTALQKHLQSLDAFLLPMSLDIVGVRLHWAVSRLTDTCAVHCDSGLQFVPALCRSASSRTSCL